jgi:NAD(P)H-flavin reductase
MIRPAEYLEANPWLPHPATIREITPEVPGIATYQLEFVHRQIAERFRFQAGQFNMLYLPGFGESAISISSDPGDGAALLHTIRAAGNVTRGLSRLRPGAQIGVRGPFGAGWPLEHCKGMDLVIAGGGVGLAPLRPVIYHVMRHRSDFKRVIVLYGARTPADLLYTREYDRWRAADVEVDVTVDIGDANWRGTIGVVPVLFYRLRLDPMKTAVMTCGPEIMMRFVIFEALARKVPQDRIYLSMERNMRCAIGFCGNCQLGSSFVCKDGPVFTYRQMAPYLHLEDL